MSWIKKYWISFVMMLMSVMLASAQPFRYMEKVFDEVDTIHNVTYAMAPWLNNPIDFLSDYNIHEGEVITEDRPLLMDIFKPRGDTLTKRPAIIFSHSGAFILGSRLVDDMVALCDSFARHGYVTATIDYRLGMGATVQRWLGIPISLSVDEKNATRALYRGIQDGRAAVRFLKENAGQYGIDTTKIYFFGSSAGSFVALHNIYLDQSDEIPSDVFEEPSLEGLDEIGVSGYGARANAVVSLWGAILDLNLIEDSTTPVFLAHGTNDDMVPFKKGMPLANEVPPNVAVSFTMPDTYGSFCIDSLLSQNNMLLHESWFVEGKGHEFYGVNTGEFPENGPNIYWDSTIQKTNNFLFEVLKPEAGFQWEADGLSVQFINSSYANYFVEWDFGDGTKSKEFNPVHSYSIQGEYNVQLKVYNRNMACDTISERVVVSDPVSSDLVSNKNIRVFPNPVKDNITITGISTPYNMIVFDIFGRKRFNIKTEQRTVSLTGLEPGIYFLLINDGGINVYRKIWKTD